MGIFNIHFFNIFLFKASKCETEAIFEEIIEKDNCLITPLYNLVYDKQNRGTLVPYAIWILLILVPLDNATHFVLSQNRLQSQL